MTTGVPVPRWDDILPPLSQVHPALHWPPLHTKLNWALSNSSSHNYPPSYFLLSSEVEPISTLDYWVKHCRWEWSCCCCVNALHFYDATLAIRAIWDFYTETDCAGMGMAQGQSTIQTSLETPLHKRL